MFSCECWEISKKTFFTEPFRMAASEVARWTFQWFQVMGSLYVSASLQQKQQPQKTTTIKTTGFKKN